MSAPVLLFVDTGYRARHLRRLHDPAVIQVHTYAERPALRVSAVLIERQRVEADKNEQEVFADLLAWAPTRLSPGCTDRVTILG